MDNVKYPYNIIIYRQNIYLAPLTYEWIDKSIKKNTHTFVDMEYLNILDQQHYVPILRQRTKQDTSSVLRIS